MAVAFKIKSLSRIADSFDPTRLNGIVRESTAEGFSMVGKFQLCWTNGRNRFDQPGEAFFIAEFEDKILAIGGRNICPYANDPQVARVRHLYVSPEWRHIGMGSAVLKHVLDMPAGMFHKICVRTMNPGARKFYERHGFKYTGEGDTTHELEL